jgi:hypothetical protein
VKHGDGTQCGVEMFAAPPVVTKHAPVLELRERVLDTSSSAPMAPPPPIPDDAISAKHRSDELRYASIATVREDATMERAQGLDGRASVMDWIVAIARAAGHRGYDPEVTPADQDLGVARIPVVLRPGPRECDRGFLTSVPSTTHDSRRSVGRAASSAASRGVSAATMRCTADFERRATAASSRMVRFVRSAAHATRMRR